MDKRTEICLYLKDHHTGNSNSIHSRELQRVFQIDGRNLRRKINRLRQDGVPICSDNTGYYYAETEQEVRNTVFRLNELSTKIGRAKDGMVSGTNGQTIVLEITIRVKEVPQDAQ